MSPRAADPDVRTALVETAARLLTEEGPSALTTRRLAREVGASTMAVYTHFGGMDELRAAISVEGFRRLGRRMDLVKHTDDPAADAVALGRAYRRNALANPDLYREMFGTHPADRITDPADQAMTLNTFLMLVDAMQRSIDAKRLVSDDAWAVAAQVWAALHGIVMLELSGFLSHADAVRTSDEMMFNLAVGLGDDPALARSSIFRTQR
ncbi:MAG: TetR/AcrR family transcriptional regulator [Actinomycetota bacterium]|nr:TetR/AcrR family transcriptional regulator [Actinomycetota bacterium]